MPAGQSIPFAVTAGTIAGLVVGQLARAKLLRRGEVEKLRRDWRLLQRTRRQLQ